MEKKIRVLCDLGVGGERGRVFDRNCVVGALSSTDYKDPPKVIKRLDIAESQNIIPYRTGQDRTGQDRRHNRSWGNRQYGQAEQGQHESVIRQRSDLHLEVTHRQRPSVSPEKVFKPFKALNDYNGKCRTIKSQYYKNSIDNFLSQGSFGATGVIRKLEEVSNGRTDG